MRPRSRQTVSQAVPCPAPDVGRQRTFPFDEFPRPPCIVEDGLDLAAMADNALVLEQTIVVALGEACYPIEIESVEGCAEVLALGEDGAPAQSELKPLEAQLCRPDPLSLRS
jgi:hypothetical protein